MDSEVLSSSGHTEPRQRGCWENLKSGREEGEARLWEMICRLEKYKPPSGEKLVGAAALWGAGQSQARTEKPCSMFLRINRDCLLFYLLDSLLWSRASPAVTWRCEALPSRWTENQASSSLCISRWGPGPWRLVLGTAVD